jgi:signal transduction histidine kinase
MDNFHKLYRQVTLLSYALSVFFMLILIGLWLVLAEYYHFTNIHAAIVVTLAGLVLVGICIRILNGIALNPLRLLSQAIVHVDPDHQGVPAPNLDQLKVGRDIVTSLALQVYQFASQQNSAELIEHRKAVIQASNIVNRLPLPMFVFNKELLVTNASSAALDYCGIESAELFGKPIFDNLNLEFGTENTLEKWIEACQDNKVTDNAYWERVHVRTKDGQLHQCDLSAHYNRENPSGADFIVTIFDRTAQYDQDDQAVGFVALAVHELRTPLTMLRGYIEVFEDELGNTLNDEMKDFMLKMEAAADQLTSFVHNILNVARIENNQLSLHLNEESWEDIIKSGMGGIELRARINHKNIEYNIASDLPTVAADRVSMYEVLNNLVDNAIKYSPNSDRIIVKASLNKQGLVETTVQDFGVGIPESVLPNLFEKFYRNHRTRTQIGGTGLGLYLSKAIVGAHGGQIWATSKEGEGTTFGFTLVPYDQAGDEMKDGDKEITRQAHGWIKNHSYYRR